MGQERARYKYDSTGTFGSQISYASSNVEGGWPASENMWVPLTTKVEYHHDIREKFNQSGIYPWHPASHVRVTCLPGTRSDYTRYAVIIPGILWGDLEEVVSYEGKWQSSEWAAYPVEATAAHAGNLYEDPDILPSGVAGGFSREAIRNVTEQMETEVSIANFLWELRDGIGSLLPKLKGNLLEIFGGNWLWWNFGAMPLVSDIKKLLNLTGTVYRRLEHLKRVNKRDVTITWKGVWDRPDTPTAVSSGEGGQYMLSVPFAPCIEWEVIKVRVNIRAHYDLDLSGSDVFLQGMVAALGLNNPAQIVWEAIPFSFVVDWFTNAQEWLEDNIDTAQPFKGTIAVNGSDHTYDRRVLYSYHAATDNKGNTAPLSQTLIRAYYRRAGLPGGTYSEDGLSAHQLSLAAALIGQGLGSNVRFRRR